MTEGNTERLFSYGTLQQESVQLANFGRRLECSADAVIGWRLSNVEIDDPEVVAESGLSVHPILVPGSPTDEVEGMVFEISPAELKAADAYETSAYRRVRVKLRSGAQAWVYVSASATISAMDDLS